jgi:hypothetical protein
MGRKRKFAYSVDWYAKHYGIGPGIAKRLSAEGVNFDDPEEMKKYATRMPTTLDELGPDQAEYDKTQEGMTRGIKRLQRDEVLLHQEYQKSKKSGNTAKITICRDAWLKMLENLRRVEVTNPEVEKLKNESVAKSDVKIAFHQIHSAMRIAIESLPDRLVHKLVGLTSAEMRTALQNEMKVLTRHLVEWEDLKREERQA